MKVSLVGLFIIYFVLFCGRGCRITSQNYDSDKKDLNGTTNESDIYGNNTVLPTTAQIGGRTYVDYVTYKGDCDLAFNPGQTVMVTNTYDFNGYPSTISFKVGVDCFLYITVNQTQGLDSIVNVFKFGKQLSNSQTCFNFRIQKDGKFCLYHTGSKLGFYCQGKGTASEESEKRFYFTNLNNLRMDHREVGTEKIKTLWDMYELAPSTDYN